MLSRYFTYSGRTRRRRFAVEILVPALLYLPAVAYGLSQMPLDGAEEEVVVTLAGFALLLALPLASFPTVRRLHDAGVPGHAVFLLLVPMANALLLLTLFLKRGTRGENQYGLPPR